MERLRLTQYVWGRLTTSQEVHISRAMAGLGSTIALLLLASCAGSEPTTESESTTAIAPRNAPASSTSATTAPPPAPATSITPGPPTATITPSPQAVAPTPAPETSPAIATEPANTNPNAVVLQSGCRMGECVELHYQGKTLVKEEGEEKLYQIDVQTYLSPMGSDEGEFWPKAASQMVLCSTERPLYVHQEADAEPYSVNQLNPGPTPPGYMMEAHMLYWVTCHDENGPDFFTPAMAEKAQSLGYSLNLTTDQNDTEFFAPFEG